jgi:methylthioribulose-1-phosphate dehydratase
MSSGVEWFSLPTDDAFLRRAVLAVCDVYQFEEAPVSGRSAKELFDDASNVAFLCVSGNDVTVDVTVNDKALKRGDLLVRTSAQALSVTGSNANGVIQAFRKRSGGSAIDDPEAPENLIPELCRQFYHLGWVTGTGGGISIRRGDLYYIAPSGVQKERIQRDDMFVVDKDRNVLRRPTNPAYKPSACTPLFFNAYDLRDAGACIHTHSMWANLLTAITPGNEFRITRQEMIKGIVGHGYLDELVVPIIENTPSEADLRDSMREAMIQYPRSTAVLVRNHGVYVYGSTWQEAKTQCECYDYLFEYAVKRKQLGF